MNILILGVSGMIGSAMFRVLSDRLEWKVYGTSRSSEIKKYFKTKLCDRIFINIDISKIEEVSKVIKLVNPDVVINCIGLTKHHQESNNKLKAIFINALFPHQLAKLCTAFNARLIHISTDCIFSGRKGSYVENDEPDARDVYGKVKYLGEVSNLNAITLRTSTIGHELNTQLGLLEWFLAQEKECVGYCKAIFSGIPNTVFALLVSDIVIPNTKLSGTYHIGAEPISKFNLLKLIADIYGKSINIMPDEEFIIDRSLNSEKFHSETGFVPQTWPKMIQSMYTYQMSNK